MVTKDEVIEALKTVIDPELMIDIWNLGLIYNIDIKDNTVNIRMTLTFPGCPYGQQLVDSAKQSLEKLGLIVNIELTFEPQWNPEKHPSDDVKFLISMNRGF